MGLQNKETLNLDPAVTLALASREHQTFPAGDSSCRMYDLLHHSHLTPHTSHFTLPTLILHLD
ncbi:hypothetical protein E2C01_094288 [Portunus trituberculatus]|uniref:Uncharacterized protein n=1 Tax=Portunus trituberculatus TaxID=210409 RepID=A0A5B7JS24_PORTR|nr:hypothetical protein [Portunus trituberculatus]